jgi:hypothetical protein
MRPHARIGPCSAGNVACLCLWCLLVQSGGSQTNSPATPRDPALETAILHWQSQLTRLEQLQAQQAATLKNIEAGQQQIARAFTQSVDNTIARLDAMNDALAAQRERSLEFIRDSNHLMLKVVAGLAGLLFLGILFMALVSSRALNRLSAMVLASPLMHPQPPPHALADEPAESRLLTSYPAGARELELQSAVRRLESRIAELENLAAHPQAHETGVAESPAGKDPSVPPVAEAHPARVTGSPRVALTVGEGAAIGFLPGEVEARGEHPKPTLFRRLRKLLFSGGGSGENERQPEVTPASSAAARRPAAVKRS